MKTLSRFVAKFTSLIVAVLSCLDRVISMGHRVCEGQPPLSFGLPKTDPGSSRG